MTVYDRDYREGPHPFEPAEANADVCGICAESKTDDRHTEKRSAVSRLKEIVAVRTK